MRTYTETLTAGQPKNLSVNGTYFVLLDAVDDLQVSIELNGTQGNIDEATIPPGYWEEFPADLRRMTATSTVTQTIRYACGWGRAGVNTAEIITQQSSSNDNEAPVTLGLTAVSVLPADVSRLRIIITAPAANVGAVAIGGPSLTAANACRWLDPGDMYEELSAAPAALYALAEVLNDKINIEVA